MDVNFSSSFSPPRSDVKTEPTAPSLFLDTYMPGSSKRSRPTTASPGKQYPGSSSTKVMPAAAQRSSQPPAAQRSSVPPGQGERFSSVAPSVPRVEDTKAEVEEDEGEEDEQARLEEEVFRMQEAKQARAKANLKVLMDNFSQEQQTRYDWYRRSTLNKANVRKLIQSTGVLVTPQVAQMVAGVGKVFVGEVVERALEIQAVRGERGPLTPEDLRQAYQMYKDEKGVIGAARPLKGKRMAL